MADEVIKRDANHTPVAAGVTHDANEYVFMLRIDSNTGGLIVTSATDAGDVAGPDSATDNAVVRFDGTTGKIVQNSSVTVSDTGVVDAASYKAGGTSPVADGTYTVGLGTPVSGQNGTITVKGGIITAIQQAQ